jgi:N-acetylglucosamine-6-phosphate deacetylase
LKSKPARPLLFTNCRLAFPDALVPGALLTQAGTIAAVWLGEAPGAVPRGTRAVDCGGLIVAPGLVDIHNHGALTHDFVGADARGNVRAMRFHAEHGVTTMLPTVMTETHEQMCAALKLLGDQHAAGALPPNFGGIHVEGPYFNPEKRGAHKLDCLRDPVRSEYEKFWKLSRGLLRIFTHAPERAGSAEFCQFFHERGCVPTIGHTKATMLEIRRVAAYGARHFVHANNAVDWPTRRAGPDGWLGSELMGMGTLLSHSAFSGEIISDGYHVPLEMIRIILGACGPDRIAIVSDASSATGCEPGEYLMGGVKIILKPNRLALTGGNLIDGVPPLGGSATPLLAMVGNYVRWGFGLTTPLKMSTQVPARIIGASKKGLLRVGHDADLIVIDDDVKLHATVIAGRVVHRAAKPALKI